MVDGRLASAQSRVQANREGHMPAEGDAYFPRRGCQRLELVGLQAGVYLDEVVSSLGLFPDPHGSLFRRTDGSAVE